MGFLLKEALKALCDSNRWCYAVFWKIGHQNPKLLIWEECHYELTQCAVPPPVPGIGSSEVLLEEWEQCLVSAETRTSQIGFQAGNNIRLLINKMMISNPVSVVGEGLVGRAAFTGNQLWILSENYVRDAHPPQVLNEVHQQFSAGMQTVAVIPVLPHGVIQLGSSLPILENFGFVNEVQRLILQLGCIPGALFTANESSPKIGMPLPIETSVSMHPSREYNLTNSNPSILDSFNQQSNSELGSRHAGQRLASVITQNQDSQKTCLLDQTPNLGQTLGGSHYKQSQSKIRPAIKPNHSFKSLPRNGRMGAEVITKNSYARLDKRASVNNSSSEISNEGGVAQSNANDCILKFMEPQLLLDDDVEEHHFNCLTASNNPISSHLRAGRGLNLNSYRGSAKKLPSYGMNNHRLPEARGSADVNLSCSNLGADEVLNAKSVRTDGVTVSTAAKSSTACHLPSEGFGHIQPIDEMTNHIDLSERKQLIENDLFQAINIPPAHQDESISWIEHFPTINDSQKHRTENECPKFKDEFPRDASLCPTGDDLFDVLGLDFKTELLRGVWNSFPENEAQEKRESKETSMSRNLKDEHSGAYVVSEGICKSEIFPGTGGDHLLDAVVSNVHSAAQQNSDENISCRTTLTNISGSSVPSKPSTNGHAIIPNKMQGGLFGLQRSLQKAATMGSSSCISGSPKSVAGTCSQASSVYGSQISSWVEQGHNFKCGRSVSTGYSKRPEEIVKSNRKRLKPGESPRPRPKDRQMIQDRVKELREIVPNGAKCSIDSLLERTIKHMLFLQSVTKHADKLKPTEESKITSKEGGVLLKDNFEGGATWAFEVGSQSMVCPIIVEDLNPPRQMLVEMLCEERGFFLEIADIIRGMGLTILKGVMEVRNDKIWARFAVEANRDVTRMDIFISLVGLLDQTTRGGAMPANRADKDSVMVCHSFPQAASIPATGGPSSFQ